MNQVDLSRDNLSLGSFGGAVFVVSGVIGLVGLGAAYGLRGIGGEDAFMKSWMFAFLIVLAVALGALFFTILQHITKAGWSVTVRRLAEGIAANLSWLWILFLPIFVLVATGNGGQLFPWADQELAAHDYLIKKKKPYLNVTFWCVRAVVFFTVWAVIARFYFRLSRRQDASGDYRITNTMQWFAPLAMILYALSQTFASYDWIMSLQPKWFSTMFGVYFFAVSVTGFFSCVLVLVYCLQRAGRVREAITCEHYHDLGKLLFAFGVVFWAYIGFSQYMLIWYANIPIETSWFFPRQLGSWFWVSHILIFGHFVLPFLLLVSRWPKRLRGSIALIAGWMVLMLCVDVYWLVIPTVPEVALAQAETYDQLVAAVTPASIGWQLNVVDFVLPVSMLSLLLSGTMFNLRRCSLVPISDPRLSESLSFENF
ncbi:MAG TPA: quinol:cytochrome C oxidoreductase [Phycisphaerales bacterium]|nr:quinol:cytochrome C oxidoreductase [Phycisphaerales bacterium]|tara:strand:- start:2018 stop:3295 length:1278 start_codon:yes stop_codon:yes gene_type:complete